jgi:SAM-dependent methyltransferase
MSLEAKYYEAPEFWADGVLTNAGNLQRIDETIALVPRDVRSLLDAGCGNGVFANRLSRARADVEVTATDRSQAALAHVTTAKFAADLTDIPRPDKSFDAVSCLQVLEHVQHQHYDRALGELARLSRRYLVIGVPFREDLLRDFTRCPECLSHFNLNFHFRSYDTANIARMFAPYGFECRLQHNIAPVRMLYGQKFYGKLRAALRKPAAPRFESPLCPVCGYENREFAAPAEHAQESTQPAHWLKRLIKKTWPGYSVPGYWTVAVFERKP